MAMTAEALTKKRSKQADDEAPTPLEAALLARLPGAPAAHAPPSSPHAPERTARSPALCEAVCALSPLELMAHLHALPMEDANLHPTPAMLTRFTYSRMLSGFRVSKVADRLGFEIWRACTRVCGLQSGARG